MKANKSLFKRVISGMMCVVMSITMFPELWACIYAEGVRNEIINSDTSDNVNSEEEVSNTYSLKDYAVFSKNSSQELCLYGWKSNFTGNVYTGSNFRYGGSEFYVNGRIDAVGEIYTDGWITEVKESNESIAEVEMTNFDEIIHENAQPYQYYEENPSYIQDENIISSSIKVSGDVIISGTSFEGDCYIIADGNITYNVDSFNTAGRVFLYSRYGNITINGSIINIDGMLYAPSGKIEFNTYCAAINGCIWADTISFNGSIFNITTGNIDMVESKIKGIAKTYTIDEDFSEGTLNGVSLSVPNQLNLSDKTDNETVPIEKVFGDTDTKKGIKVTYSSDKSVLSGTDTEVNVGYDLSGFGDADVNENAVDLIIVVDESGSMSGSRMTNAKAAAKEVVSKMKDNDRCAIIGFTSSSNIRQQLTSDKSLLETAINKLSASGSTYIYKGIDSAISMFDSMSSDDRQKYIILISDGEDGATAQSLASATNAGLKNTRIFAMMIGTGTLQMQNIAINSNGIYKNAPTVSDISSIMSYFASEVFDVAGRNAVFKTTIKNKDLIDIENITPEPTKVTENSDGSITLEWFFDRIKVNEIENISLPVNIKNRGENFVDITQDTSCVYYGRDGKPNIIYLDDVSIPVCKYVDSGLWSTVFDSKQDNINWENIYWNGMRYGDSKIEVTASTSSDGVNFSEATPISNHQDNLGLSGRYIKIDVNMTVSSDGKTPELFDITVISEGAEIPALDNIEPTAQIITKDVCKVNVPFNIRADILDDCLKSALSVEWTCSDDSVLFEDSTKLITTAVCTEIGSFDIICTVNDGEKIISSFFTVIAEPSDSYADIDPDTNESPAPLISVDLPNYADKNQVINTKIEKLNNTEISWYSVIFRGNTAVSVDDDGNFSLKMPNTNGTYSVVVRAFDWAGKLDVKEYKIIVDSAVPSIEVKPSSNVVFINDDAYFTVLKTAEHKINSIKYTVNGNEVAVSEGGIFKLDTSNEGEYEFKAVAMTTAGLTISSTAIIKVIYEDAESPIAALSFDKDTYIEGDTVIATVSASDNIGVVLLEALVNGQTATINDNEIIITDLKLGKYVFTVKAYDDAGNIGTCTKTIDVLDKTAPELTIEADKTEIVLGESVNIIITASDNSGMVTTALTVNKKSLAIVDNQAMFTPEQAGEYVFVAKATDPSGNFSEDSITVKVLEPDIEPPVVSLTFDKDTYFERDDILVSVSAIDNIGVEKLILTVDGIEVKLDRSGAYTISNAEKKDYEIIAKAYDKAGNEGVISANVIVNEALAPIISAIFDKESYIEGDNLIGLITAEGQREIITLTAEVNGIAVSLDDNGKFEMNNLTAGSYVFIITAEDAKGFTSTIEKTIIVSKKDNSDKRITAEIAGIVEYGETAVLTITATEEIDKSTIKATLNGESITLNTNLTYDFNAEKLFKNTFTITAKTTGGEELLLEISTQVVDTVLPTLTVTFDKDIYQANENMLAHIEAADNCAIKRIEFTFDGVEYPIDENGYVTIPSIVVEPHAAVVRVWDTFGNCITSVTAFIVIIVDGETIVSETDGDDGTTLNSIIYTPADGKTITAPTTIIGTAGGTDFVKYRLDYAPVSGGVYTILKESTTPVNASVLGEIDPTLLKNGLYRLRLTVFNENGSKTTNFVVSVEGNMKIGNFSIAFQDMDINVAGLPLTVIRSYDSRDRNIVGDFGYGWNMSTAGVTITESCTLGSYWTQIKQSGAYGMASYAMKETRAHIITINWGNGQTEKFKVTTNPSTSTLYPIQYGISYVFTAQDGSKSKLQGLNDASDLLYEDGEIYSMSSFDVSNPTRYKLTKADGTVYIIHKTNGVESITDPNGNKITFTKNGITHSDGKNITFKRDSSGRITSITSPTGKSMVYTYDTNGDLTSVTDITGETTSFEYENHYLTNIIDPRGVRVSRNIYDDNGRLIKTIDSDGNEIKYDHDIRGREERITDRNGNVTRYIYDSKGNILSETDPMGNTVKSTYDSNSNLATKTDALGNVTTYNYDSSGNLLGMTDAMGNTVSNSYSTKSQLTSINAMGVSALTVTYDNKGNTSSTTDALGNDINYSYDGKGNLTSVTDEIGTYMNLTYDSKGNVVSATNGAGVAVQFTYDDDGNCLSKTLSRLTDSGVETITEHYEYDNGGNLIKIIDSDGNITATEYNSMGKIASATDEKGRKTTYDYDDFGNLIKITYSDATAETFTYDREGNNITATDRMGRTVTIAYDKVGNLINKTYPNGSKVTYAYDANYNLISTTSASGGIAQYEYDKIGRNTAVIDALGNRTSYVYNGHSQLESMTDAKGYTYTYSYDLNGNRVKTTYPDGTSISSTYDARGRVTSNTDQNGYSTSYSYDGADRLTSVTDALGNVTSYTYDEVGNLTTVTDANTNVTRYNYDDFGRVVKTTNALGQISEFTYDSMGNILTATDYAGKQTTYAYDNFDRISSKTTSDGTVSYSHTVDGKLESVQDSTGTTTFTYNGMDGLSKVVYPDGNYVEYSYDDGNRLTKTSTAYGETAYEYDLLERVVRVVGRNGLATVYEYDANGNRSAVRYANGITVTYEYDEVNRLINEKTLDKDSRTVAEYVYTLGLAGERIAVAEIDKTIEYTYDELYRLVGEKITDSKGNVKEHTYAYDDVSNRILKTENGAETVYTYNALNQLISENDTTYEYDNAGNLVRTIAPTKSALYEYNAENKLIKATVQNGVNVTVEEYTYDFAGNRTSKSTITNGIVEITYYLNDISGGLTQVLAELDADGDEKCFYTRGFELISQERDGEVSYYLTDGHGSVRQLANENGNITDTYNYDAWGNLTSSTGSTVNTYRYCGEQFDGTTGLYYLRARYMDPSTGTFISMDTYQGSTFDPITLHKYLYANANPVMNCDPSGYMSMGEMSATMEARESLDEAYAAHNAWAIRMGKKILISLRIGTYIGVSVSLLFGEELLDLCSDVLGSELTAGDISIGIMSEIISRAISFVKATSITDDISLTKNKSPKGSTYYHATSAVKATEIMLTGVMKGSSWEGGYVFAWRFKPNKKALKLSGAKHMEIVIQFETTASFSQDPAFINSKNTNLSLSELKYINSFSPVRTTFSQSIRVKNVKIVSKF